VITGGEPTILGDKFFRLVSTIKAYLPTTSVHVLSNGRTFKDVTLAQKLASIAHPDLMLGIPLYSDVASLHDFVVQADGAFDETIAGILNLKRYGQRIELRVVIHAQTYKRLPQLAEFIVRNLQFVDQVSLMGLEPTGFALANLSEMWIDPYDYQNELERAGQGIDLQSSALRA
jgi:His-Xaa-Ser system radical SAM maturase HxsC